MIGDILANVEFPLGLREIAVSAPTRSCDPRGGIDLPHPNHMVATRLSHRVCTCRSKSLAVRAEGHTPYNVVVAHERFSERLSGGCIPQPHRLIVTSGSECFA